MSGRNRATVILCLLAVLLTGILPTLAQETPIEIRMWIAFTDARLDWAREKAAAFNELYPQYNVVIEGYTNYEELFAATALAFEQGTQPAIVQYFEAATQNARDARLPDGSPAFKPISEAIGDREEINGQPVDFEDIVSSVSNYYTLDGAWTSMPWNTSSAIFYANVDMLEAAGVTELPTTWAEVEAACEAIMAMDNPPAGCITWPNYGWFFEQSVAQQGADLANNGNGREARATEVYLTSDAMMAYVNWWADMAERGYYVYTGVQRDWDGVNNAFFAQQVAMIITSSSDVTSITATGTENGFTVRCGFMPYNQDVEYVGNLIGGASLWLANGLAPEVEEGALTFLLWFTNTENAAEWHQFTGYVPIRTSAVQLLEEQGWYEESPNSRVASDQLAAARLTSATSGALIGNFPAIRNEVTAAMEDILINGTDPMEAFSVAQENANQLLAEYNLLNAPEE